MSSAIFTHSITFTHRSGSERQASKKYQENKNKIKHISWLLFTLIIVPHPSYHHAFCYSTFKLPVVCIYAYMLMQHTILLLQSSRGGHVIAKTYGLLCFLIKINAQMIMRTLATSATGSRGDLCVRLSSSKQQTSQLINFKERRVNRCGCKSEVEKPDS